MAPERVWPFDTTRTIRFSVTYVLFAGDHDMTLQPIYWIETKDLGQVVNLADRFLRRYNHNLLVCALYFVLVETLKPI